MRWRKARRCARTQLWLTVGECIAALCLPLLALFPFAIPDAALKLALASLGMLIAAALFAQQILHLPQRAADCAAKAERLRKLRARLLSRRRGICLILARRRVPVCAACARWSSTRFKPAF